MVAYLTIPARLQVVMLITFFSSHFVMRYTAHRMCKRFGVSWFESSFKFGILLCVQMATVIALPNTRELYLFIGAFVFKVLENLGFY